MENKNKEPMIYKNKALRDLRGIKDVLVGLGDPFLANMLNRAIECIERQTPIENTEVVVHCRECIHRDTSKCPMYYSQRMFMMGDNGFCSCGDDGKD